MNINSHDYISFKCLLKGYREIDYIIERCLFERKKLDLKNFKLSYEKNVYRN